MTERITTDSRRSAQLIPENIPHGMKNYRHWVVHLEKQPYNPTTGRRASTTDSRTWGTFEEALNAYYKTGHWSGIGFVFSSGDPYTGIDLDDCRDPQTGVIEEWAQGWLDTFGGYTEVSSSETGLHIIVQGKTPRNGKITECGKAVEIYSVERFFTITGVRP